MNVEDSLGNTTIAASWGDSDVSLPSFEVTGGVTDTAGPDITSVTFSQDSAAAGEEVTVTVIAEDAESEVEGVMVYIINPGGGNSYLTCEIGEQSGQCQASFTVGSGDFQMLGTYEIEWVMAEDSLGNNTTAASWGDSTVSRPGFVVSQ